MQHRVFKGSRPYWTRTFLQMGHIGASGVHLGVQLLSKLDCYRKRGGVPSAARTVWQYAADFVRSRHGHARVHLQRGGRRSGTAPTLKLVQVDGVACRTQFLRDVERPSIVDLNVCESVEIAREFDPRRIEGHHS